MRDTERDTEQRLSDVEARCKFFPEEIIKRMDRQEEKLDALLNNTKKNGNGKVIKWMVGIIVTSIMMNLATIAIVVAIVNK